MRQWKLLWCDDFCHMLWQDEEGQFVVSTYEISSPTADTDVGDDWYVVDMSRPVRCWEAFSGWVLPVRGKGWGKGGLQLSSYELSYFLGFIPDLKVDLPREDLDDLRIIIKRAGQTI